MMRDHIKNAVVLLAAVVGGWAAGHFVVSEFVMGSADPRKSWISAESRAQDGAAREPRMRSTVGGRSTYSRGYGRAVSFAGGSGRQRGLGWTVRDGRSSSRRGAARAV